MRPRVTLVLAVGAELPVTHACLESLRATTEPFVLLAFDRGGGAGRRSFFELAGYPRALLADPDGPDAAVAALNRAWRQSETEFLCMVHDDTEMLDRDWLGKLLAPLGVRGTGMTGLYGARRVRRDGHLAADTIVHSLAAGPTVPAAGAEVAALDGVCLCLPRAVLSAVGGFDEAYGVLHGYDRDLSLAVREIGHACRVVQVPFQHHATAARAGDLGAWVADLARRRAARERFARKWRRRLPCDVRPMGARVRAWARGLVRPA